MYVRDLFGPISLGCLCHEKDVLLDPKHILLFSSEVTMQTNGLPELIRAILCFAGDCVPWLYQGLL